MKKIIIVTLVLCLFFVGSVTGATQYTCCKSFVNTYGTGIEYFDNVSEWNVTGASIGKVSQDTTHYINGGKAIKLYTSNNVQTLADKNLSLSPINMSNFTNKTLTFWVYVEPQTAFPSTTLSTVQILFGELENFTSTPAKYVFISVAGNELVEGWNPILVSNSTITQQNGAYWNDMTIRNIRINARATTGNSANVTFDNLRIGYNARPKIAITFDDNYQSVYTKAYPILSANSQNATVFYITTAPSMTFPIMNFSTIAYLYNQGWDIGSHSATHQNLVTNWTTHLYELEQSMSDLNSFGFTRSSRIIAYPGGVYNTTLLNDAASVGYLLGRTVIKNDKQGFEPIYGYENLNLKMTTFSFVNTTTNASVRLAIDNTIEKTGFLIINLHEIKDSGEEANQIIGRTDVLQNMSNYIDSRSSEIDVILLSDFIMTAEVQTINGMDTTVGAGSNNFIPMITVVFIFVILFAFIYGQVPTHDEQMQSVFKLLIISMIIIGIIAIVAMI